MHYKQTHKTKKNWWQKMLNEFILTLSSCFMIGVVGLFTFESDRLNPELIKAGGGRFLSSTTPIRPLIQSDNHLYTNMITKVDIFRSPQLNDRNIFFGLLDFWGDFLFLTKNAWNIIIISYIYIFILRIKMFLDVISIVMFCLAYSPVCYCFCFMIWLWR